MPSSISARRRMQEVVLDIRQFEARYKMICRKNRGAEPDDQQASSCQHACGDPAQRWAKSPCEPILQSRHKPGWVDLKLAELNTSMKTPPESVSTSVEGRGSMAKVDAHGGPSDIGICRDLCDNGRISDALDALSFRARQGDHIDNNLLYRVLKRCISHRDLVMGRRIHALAMKVGYGGDPFLATHLISLYASHGRLDEAMQVFTMVSIPTVHNWTNIIFAFARHGEAAQAIRLYRHMLETTSIRPDNRLYVAVLKACATAGDLVAGKEVHAHILSRSGKLDSFVQAGLVSMYVKCGSLGDARRVFDRLRKRDVVIWNAILAGYAQQGRGHEALSLYRSMQQEGLTSPDCVTYACLLQACASIGVGAVEQGTQLHAEIDEQGLRYNIVLGGSLVNMYAKCGSLADAQRLFDKLPERDVVTWNGLIAGYTLQGMSEEALSLYSRMQQECLSPANSVTYVCLLQTCSSLGVGALDQGKQLHAQIEERGLQDDLVLGGTLINMYAKCGSLGAAQSVFDRLPDRNVAICNALLAAYAQWGMSEEALSLYNRMLQEGRTAPDSVTYVYLLQACASDGVQALDRGKQVHAQIEGRRLQVDAVLGGSLVNMYVKCGSLGDACRIFDRLPERDSLTWNALLSGYAQQGMGEEAIVLYSRMKEEGISPSNSVTYVCLLRACASVGFGALRQGKQLHAEIEGQGVQVDLVLGGSLVNMYAKCGNLRVARRVFDRLPQKNVVIWNALLAAHTQQGQGQEALALYRLMQEEGSIAPDSLTYVCLLHACASIGVGAVDYGKHLHAEITEQGLEGLDGSLVNMYAKCGSLGDAQRVFDRISERDVVTWNAMLAAYAHQGMGEEALSLYSRMQQEGSTAPDSVTFVCLLQACAGVGVGALPRGKQLHAHIRNQGLKEDLVLGGSLISMFAKCGSLEDACEVFERLPDRDAATWNALLAGYAQQGMGEEALRLYSRMQQEGSTSPDSVTYVCLLQACASVGVRALGIGKQIHAEIVERRLQEDLSMSGSLVNMYAKCGSLGEARWVFDRLPKRDVSTWNALLSGYAQQGMGEEAISLYSRMQEECLSPSNSVTYVCLLQACASVGLGALDLGKELHAKIDEQGLQKDMVLGGSLVNMYAKCGSLGDACRVFNRLPEKNVVIWNALFAGYAQDGIGQEALRLYSSMLEEGSTDPDSVTYVCLLRVCAFVAALPMGKQLHADIKERGLQADAAVGTGLVNMYAKCGSMSDSQQVFDSLPERPIEAWNALSTGYAHQGDSELVFELVGKMRLEGKQPDGITFLSLLTVCSHVGQVDKGLKYFEVMTSDYGISPSIEHYTCIMDLLGRAGHLEEALQMAKTMCFPPNSVVWLTLLGACRNWNNVEIGKQAFESAITQDGNCAASYVLMSSIYANAEMWEDAKEMQARRKKCGAWKQPGQSWWTDMSGVAHTFVAGEKKRP